jgi:hypothetical protein
MAAHHLAEMTIDQHQHQDFAKMATMPRLERAENRRCWMPGRDPPTAAEQRNGSPASQSPRQYSRIERRVRAHADQYANCAAAPSRRL